MTQNPSPETTGKTPGVAHIAVEDPTKPEIAQLVAELDEEMNALYQTMFCYLSSVEELSEDYVHFLVARFQGHPVACAALMVKDIDWAEIKRVYTRPVVRGKGLSKALINGLLDRAKELGLKTLKLECGTKQPEALALYGKLGFVQCEAFAEYQDLDTPESVFMEMKLV